VHGGLRKKGMAESPSIPLCPLCPSASSVVCLFGLGCSTLRGPNTETPPLAERRSCLVPCGYFVTTTVSPLSVWLFASVTPLESSVALYPVIVAGGVTRSS